MSTTATSAASRCSSSATSRQNSRAGPHSSRSRTLDHRSSGLRASQSLTRSVSGWLRSLSGAYWYRRNEAPADSNLVRSPSVPSTRTWWPRAAARPTTVWTASTPPPLSQPGHQDLHLPAPVSAAAARHQSAASLDGQPAAGKVTGPSASMGVNTTPPPGPALPGQPKCTLPPLRRGHAPWLPALTLTWCGRSRRMLGATWTAARSSTRPGTLALVVGACSRPSACA